MICFFKVLKVPSVPKVPKIICFDFPTFLLLFKNLSQHIESLAESSIQIN